MGLLLQILQLLAVLFSVTALAFTHLQRSNTQIQRGTGSHVTQRGCSGSVGVLQTQRSRESTRLHLFGFGGKKKDTGSQPAHSKEKKPDPKCKLCKGKGAVKCTAGQCVNGIDKKYGSVLERFTCKVCKGFGLVACSCTGSAGLTPEQTGER